MCSHKFFLKSDVIFGSPCESNASLALLESDSMLTVLPCQTRKPDSPFLNLGAPAVLTTSTAPPVRRHARIKYTRDELLKMRKNVLMTDLPPGFDTAFLREQQELAQAFDRGYGTSPPNKAFQGASSFDSKRSWSAHSSIEVRTDQMK
eukprot:scaffold15779_cov45-Prasinocladus_malaysianus.AAC.2